MVYTDQLGREFTIAKKPVRIISLVPSQTELLVAMGLSDHIVGVTKFCVHPDSIRKEKTIVGGTKKVHYDKIKALRPDIILCNKEENTKEMVETLQMEYPVHVSDIGSMEESLEMIEQYGEIFEKKTEADALISKIKSELRSFKKFLKDKPQQRVAYFIWRKPWMVAGRGTFIHHILELNGFVNVYGNQERYPEVIMEELQNRDDLDLVLLSSEPFPFSNEHLIEVTELVPNTKVSLVDGEYFSWYGSRLVDAFSYFKTLH
ncbi:ABC transporter substrate-binding protein [Aquimarina sp. 2201CG14-23]|uniref:ABC transporter substrate-binding protein n=1 Tax=Aquimarina mycalae TaxID=3040073 RepID=UPI0024782166|nr:helical backbone metal receptor [Aquimarina sp. 2201CG14-23]MDH7444512.1 helical backbone metal receptor [Aquimarina sp. 2201CG14-23]